MIRRANECTVKHNEHMRGGDGTVIETSMISGSSELNDKGRLFSKLILKPGCSIGFHIHEGDTEIYYILNGTGEYSDNGEICQVTAGDVTICPAGTGHGIANKGDDLLELVAVIVYV